MEGKDDIIGQLKYGIGAKSIAIQYLKDKGQYPFQDGHVFNYSARQKETEHSTYKDECWVNPNPDRLVSDWYLILNDMERKLHILKNPTWNIPCEDRRRGWIQDQNRYRESRYVHQSDNFHRKEERNQPDEIQRCKL